MVISLKTRLPMYCRLWMDGVFAWMKPERVAAPEEEVTILAREDSEVDSARVGEVDEVTPEVDTSCLLVFSMF